MSEALCKNFIKSVVQFAEIDITNQILYWHFHTDPAGKIEAGHCDIIDLRIVYGSDDTMSKYTLNPELLHAAYSQGYFPMPDADTEEILWFRPDPRAIIPLDQFHVSRSLSRTLKKKIYQVTYDKSFQDVMLGCASHPNTWINQEFIDVYGQMFAIGLAHSVEVWHQGALVGGTYGVSLGGAFFAESKFHRMTDASKVALYCLVEQMKTKGYTLLECQFLTPHLESLGAVEISDVEYIAKLNQALKTDAMLT